MVKARILAALAIVILMIVAVSPGTSLAAVPGQPTNESPADNSVDISLTPLLRASIFQDDDGNDTHYASQWQIRGTEGKKDADGRYLDPVFDSGVSVAVASPGDPQTLLIPAGHLGDNTTYYWHVRYMDDTGWWSDWSDETMFTTIAAGVPTTPVNVSPLNEASEIGLTPLLIASAFATVNGVGTHTASHWQITTKSGDYSSPLFDSGIAPGTTQISIVESLLSDTTYFWRARYQDMHGRWSGWSVETSFTTIANLPPNQPVNLGPADGAEDVSLTPTLTSSTFADSEGDAHDASRWQVTNTAGDYSDTAMVWDSGTDATSLTSIKVPSGMLSGDTTYYWRVQYQDSRDGWSAWSAETHFTTALPPEPAPPVAGFSASAIEVIAETGVVTFTDVSSGSQLVAWEWDFGDGSDNVTWNVLNKPRDGDISYTYAEPGTYTVSLKVTGVAGTDVASTVITASAVPKASFVALAKDNVVELRDTSTPVDGITLWKWSFGDGTVVQWDATARAAAEGKISHEYETGGNKVVSLEVSGPLGKHTVNQPIELDGEGGLAFAWWMVLAGVGGLIVIGGVAFLISRRMAH